MTGLLHSTDVASIEQQAADAKAFFERELAWHQELGTFPVETFQVFCDPRIYTTLDNSFDLVLRVDVAVTGSAIVSDKGEKLPVAEVCENLCQELKVLWDVQYPDHLPVVASLYLDRGKGALWQLFSLLNPECLELTD